MSHALCPARIPKLKDGLSNMCVLAYVIQDIFIVVHSALGGGASKFFSSMDLDSSLLTSHAVTPAHLCLTKYTLAYECAKHGHCGAACLHTMPTIYVLFAILLLLWPQDETLNACFVRLDQS